MNYYLELAKELKDKSVEEIALQLEKIDGGDNSRSSLYTIVSHKLNDSADFLVLMLSFTVTSMVFVGLSVFTKVEIERLFFWLLVAIFGQIFYVVLRRLRLVRLKRQIEIQPMNKC